MCQNIQKKSIVVCQPVTNPSTLQPHPVENDEQDEEVDLSSVKVQLFPADTPVPLHNEETSLTILPVEAVQDVTCDNETRLINLPAQATTDGCMPLAQTMDLTVTNTDNAQSLHLPTWYIETMTSDLEPLQIHSDISKRCLIIALIIANLKGRLIEVKNVLIKFYELNALRFERFDTSECAARAITSGIY